MRRLDPMSVRQITLPVCTGNFTASWSSHGQAHLSSPEQETHSHAWLSRANGDQVGPRSTQPSPEERTQAPHGAAPVEIRRRLSRHRARISAYGGVID